MPFLERVVAETQRRVALLPQEVEEWRNKAEANIDALGIYRSRFRSLHLMMGALAERQRTLQAQLLPTLPLWQFSNIYVNLLTEIVGTHDLWRIFRFIFGQRQDERVQTLVKAADLVASDCYLSCMDRARAWGLVNENQFREPPLVYLEAETSAVTASRGVKFQALNLTLLQYRSQRLPIPIVVLPADQATSIWLFSALHHEVGHNLDQDLKLTPELKQLISERLKTEGADLGRRQTWQLWTAEILADVFGVLLGGAGFGHSMASLLLLLAPLSPAILTDDDHPDHYVRVYLVQELLRRCGVPALTEAANQIKQFWDGYQKPAGIESYLKESDIVAEIMLTKPLEALGKRPLLQIVPDLAGDTKRIAGLAKHLRTGLLSPNPKQYTWRLVPPAAQLAFSQLDNPDAAALDKIQERALAFGAAIEIPQFLAGADHDAFLLQLTNQISFTTERTL
jgi:hypothetical protein